MLVILTNNRNDPIVQTLKSKYLILDIKTFLSEIEIYDEITPNKTTICWQKGELYIRNDGKTLLLNRLIQLNLNDVISFDENDRLYALMELQAYFGFALSHLTLLNHHRLSHGSEPCLTLPNQWELIKTLMPTPNYYWGDRRFNHLPPEKLIYGNIHIETDWQINLAPPPENKLIFCYKRPEGIPCFVFSIGEKHLICPYKRDDQNKALLHHDKLIMASKNCNKKFNYFIAETLFFLSNTGELTFAFSSPKIRFCQSHPEFQSFLQQEIQYYAAHFYSP